MTEKIYDTDPHILTFEAVVQSCEEAKTPGQYAVILNRTAFFPEEGGQGSDDGILGGLPVLHVSIDKENTLTHFLPGSLPVGSTVSGSVDWEKRFDYMQQHTGEHILSGLIHKHFGYNNVGFHLGDDTTTLDFDGVISPEEMRRIELLANEAVAKNLPVNTSFPSKEELSALSYRSKIELTGAVRIVEIPGIDICACCAPHVDSTGQIGMIKIADLQSHRGGVRITILCGSRALLDYQVKQDTISTVSALLSAKPELIADAVIRLKEESQGRQERINALQAKLLAQKLSTLPSPDTTPHAILFEDPMDTKAVRDAVNTLAASYPGYSAIFTGNDADGYNFILGSSTLDCNTAAKALRETHQAKCGGSKQMIQGSVTVSAEQINNLLLSLT